MPQPPRPSGDNGTNPLFFFYLSGYLFEADKPLGASGSDNASLSVAVPLPRWSFSTARYFHSPRECALIFNPLGRSSWIPLLRSYFIVSEPQRKQTDKLCLAFVCFLCNSRKIPKRKFFIHRQVSRREEGVCWLRIYVAMFFKRNIFQKWRLI